MLRLLESFFLLFCLCSCLIKNASFGTFCHNYNMKIIGRSKHLLYPPLCACSEWCSFFVSWYGIKVVILVHPGAFQEHTNCCSTLLVLLLLFHFIFFTYLHHDSLHYIYITAIHCNLIPIPVMQSNYRNFVWTTDGNSLNVIDLRSFVMLLKQNPDLFDAAHIHYLLAYRCSHNDQWAVSQKTPYLMGPEK